MVVTGLKIAKHTNRVNFWYVFAIFKPTTATKTLSSYFHLVEEF